MEELCIVSALSPSLHGGGCSCKKSVSAEELTSQSAQLGFHGHLQGKQEEGEIPLAYSAEERKDGLQYLAGG